MRNRLYSTFTLDLDKLNSPKYPIIVAIILIYIATVFVQSTYKLSLNAIIWFTIAMIIHLLVYLFSKSIFKHRYWLYFIVQGIIVVNCAVIMPRGYETIFLGLIPLLIFQSMTVYYDGIKVIIASIFFYSIFCGTIIVFDGVKELIKYIPILILVTTAVRAYSAIFIKQVKLRIQTEKVLKELELAYDKVEELTLTNERQRVARDLHDTLSQGIAGIIMQLEAVSANLNNNNVRRAQEIVQKSMEHARKTLSDSRLVINDLRFHENADIDLVSAVENEIAEFKSVSNTSIKTDIRIQSQIPVKIVKHILYIVRESLGNIAKHAKAKNVIVKIIEAYGQININIIDDGTGFDIKLLDKQFGHYGIMGVTERVKAIHGEIKIKSQRKAGTDISIMIPIRKEIDE